MPCRPCCRQFLASQINENPLKDFKLDIERTYLNLKISLPTLLERLVMGEKDAIREIRQDAHVGREGRLKN